MGRVKWRTAASNLALAAENLIQKSLEPLPHNPARAKQLLAEAGYPNGFDAGELYQLPPYFSLGEAIIGNLQAVGIKLKMRPMERAAYFSALQTKKLRRFGDPEAFRSEVDRVIAALKALPQAPGALEVLMPGERGSRALASRTRDGIPLPRAIVEELRGVAARFGVAMFPSAL